MDNSGIKFWTLISFDQKALNGKVANVLTLVNIGIEWIRNQSFLRLNRYHSLQFHYQVWHYMYYVWNHNLPS